MSKKRKQYPSQYRRQIIVLVPLGTVAGGRGPRIRTVGRHRPELGSGTGRHRPRPPQRRDHDPHPRHGPRPRSLHERLPCMARATALPPGRAATTRSASRCARAGRPDAGPAASPAFAPTSRHGASRRRRKATTTVRDADARPAPDPGGPELPRRRPGRRAVGWSTETHLRTELVEQALAMALERRGPAVIHHSDQGTQYTSWAFGRRCEQAGMRRNGLMAVFIAGVDRWGNGAGKGNSSMVSDPRGRQDRRRPPRSPVGRWRRFA